MTEQPTWAHPREALALLLRGRTVRTAVPVAAVVGIVLSAVNQGATIASGRATDATWLRIAVNFLVPFLVASFGYLSARRVPPPPPATGPGRPEQEPARRRRPTRRR